MSQDTVVTTLAKRPALACLCVAALAAPLTGCGPRQGDAAPAVDSSLVIRTPGLDSLPSYREMFERYNTPYPPFTVIGNVHYVGASGVSAFLITTPEGHFLLDGGFAETAPQIIDNIRTLGFSIRDVRILLNSHAHFDHSGGLAALKAASGAVLMAGARDRTALQSGHAISGPATRVATAPVVVERALDDGDSVTFSGVTIVAIATPGHTPGCTSYLTTVEGRDRVPRRVLFHCSASVAGQSLAPESYPGVVEDYRRSFARIGGIRADVFLANHGEVFDLERRRQRLRDGDDNAFVDGRALGAYNASMRRTFEQELARQQGGTTP